MAQQLVFATTIHSSMIHEGLPQDGSRLQTKPYWTTRGRCSREEHMLLEADGFSDTSKVVRAGGYYGVIWDQNTRRVVVPVFNGLEGMGPTQFFAHLELIARFDRKALSVGLEKLFFDFRRDTDAFERYKQAWDREVARYKAGELDHEVGYQLKDMRR